MSIRKGGVYGAYKVVAKNDKLYRCICTFCNKKKSFLEKSLILNPKCKGCKYQIGVTHKKNKKLSKSLSNNISKLKQDVNFESSLEKINELLTDSSTQDGVKYFQVTALKVVMDLIPYAEESYRQKPNINTSATIVTLINQARDLAADLSDNKSYNSEVYENVVKILHPAFLHIGQILLNSAYRYKLSISDYNIDEEESEDMKKKLDQTFVDIGKSVENVFYDVRKSISEYMIEG